MSAECTCVECGAAFDYPTGQGELCPSCIPDQYGNTEREPNKYCCFPNCGCDGSRLCQAERGPNAASCAINIERGSL